MKIWFELLLISIGGALGAISRYSISQLSSHLFKTEFPVGTFIANVVGCFLIGLLIGSGRSESSQQMRLAIGIGFLGALTTFSTFGAETILRFEKGQLLIAAGNVMANVILGMAAVVAGLWIGRKLA